MKEQQGIQIDKAMNEELLENLNRRLDEAITQSREVLADDDLRDRLQELKDKTESLVRKHPVGSIAVGLLAGFILGKLFSADEEA